MPWHVICMLAIASYIFEFLHVHVIEYSPFATTVMFASLVSPLSLVASQIYTTSFGVARTVIRLPSFDWSDQCHVTSFTGWFVQHVRLTSPSTHAISFGDDSIVTLKSSRNPMSLALLMTADKDYFNDYIPCTPAFS